MPSLMNQLFIQPTFAVIKILPGDRVILQQKTATHRVSHAMHDGNLIRRKHFRTRKSSHDLPPLSGKLTTPEYPAFPPSFILPSRSLPFVHCHQRYIA